MSTVSPLSVLLEILVGVCRPALQILTLFQTKKCDFPHPFTGLYNPYLFWDLGIVSNSSYIIAETGTPTKRFFNIQREWANIFTHCRSSLKNHTWFQTNMDKVYTRFQTKTGENPTRWGGTHQYGLFFSGYMVECKSWLLNSVSGLILYFVFPTWDL